MPLFQQTTDLHYTIKGAKWHGYGLINLISKMAIGMAMD
jgi:hypothetical protein